MSDRRQRRTDEQVFIDALTALSKGGAVVRDDALMPRLGWNKIKYDRKKSQMLRERKIASRYGRLSLSGPPSAKAISAFISYSTLDKVLAITFEKHLEPLRKAGILNTWKCSEIQPGDDWKQAIEDNLAKSDMILLLVSVNFINSDYCFDVEFRKALAMRNNGRAVVIPVILSECLWRKTPLEKLQALPKAKDGDCMAVTAWANQDAAFTAVAEGLWEAAEEIRRSRT